jgi:hypothetical protein
MKVTYSAGKLRTRRSCARIANPPPSIYHHTFKNGPFITASS